MRLILTLTGTKPMLQHNSRLANPLDPVTVDLKKLTAKRKKTLDDLAAIMHLEAKGGAYETEEGLLGLPTENVWACLYDAATAFRRGADIKRALSYSPDVQPLLVDGGKVRVADYLQEWQNIDYRSVVVNRGRCMRARPIVRNWSSHHEFDLLEDVIDPGDLVPILDRAGRLVGVGDWRPIYGTFTVEVEQ